MFKTREEGGGGQRTFKQCLKKLHNWRGMASLILAIEISDSDSLSIYNVDSTCETFFIDWPNNHLSILVPA